MHSDTSGGRITVRQDGVVVPIVEHAVQRCPDLVSRGLLIEHHAIEKSEFPKREVQMHVAYMHTGPSVQAEIEGPGLSLRKRLRPGMVWLMPQGSQHAVRFHGKVEGLGFAFTPERFDQLLASANVQPSQPLKECIITDYPKLEHLLRALAHEITQPNEPGLLTAECIAAAAALTLSQPVKPEWTLQRQSASGLTGRQLEAVASLVAAHISEPISLQSLADAVGLSPFHFLRAFKHSTGTTPHRYVLEQRIETAKQLLRLRKGTIAEVGLMVGFAHQSHFARAFRSHVRVTPTEFSKNS